MLRFLLLLLSALTAFGADARPEIAPSQADKPYVLLISLDGFRYDYAQRDHAANLLEFGRKGVAAKALIPSFPTSTFPNHNTIATGLYPAHHGIVENSFWDPQRKALFRFNDPSLASDPAWWGGTPLWVLAEQQGMRAASYFWPGSDYEIQHTRPTYYHTYDGKVTKDQQIAEVIGWLKLPKSQRPHFITVYFSEVDHESHLHGPDAPETREAIAHVDAALGKLFDSIRDTGVPVNIFVVSDHGMSAVQGAIDVSKFADLTGVETVAASTEVKIYSDDAARIESLYNQFKDKDPRFNVYRPGEIPSRLHYSGNPRIGDLVLMAAKPVILHLAPRPGERMREPLKGMHGYDVDLDPEMKAIFYAQGPDLKSGLTIEEFQNIHIFPLIVRILGLQPPPDVDGQLSVLAPILR
jgi:alkaline phosphatase D